MASSTERTTVIFHINLGLASKYPKEFFPLEYYETNKTLDKGSLLLYATMEEMKKIASMGIDLNTDENFRDDTMAEYWSLTTKEKRLQRRPKTSNPITKFRNYRAERMFHAAAKTLFVETKRTSERAQRRKVNGENENYVQAAPNATLHIMNAAAPQDANISGIAVTLDGPLDDAARQTLDAAVGAMVSNAHPDDPFEDDPNIPQLDDDDAAVSLADTASLLTQDELIHESGETGTLCPASPSVVNNIYVSSSIFTMGSNITAPTLNSGIGNTGGNMRS